MSRVNFADRCAFRNRPSIHGPQAQLLRLLPRRPLLREGQDPLSEWVPAASRERFYEARRFRSPGACAKNGTAEKHRGAPSAVDKPRTSAYAFLENE